MPPGAGRTRAGPGAAELGYACGSRARPYGEDLMSFSCERGVTCAWGSWGCGAGSGDASAASPARGTAPEGDLASRGLGDG